MKSALCTTRNALLQRGVDLSKSQGLISIPENLLTDLPVHMEYRKDCEQVPELQQLLPYVTLHDEQSRFFVYGRGPKGGEQRLVGKLSLGLGGHVDTAPFGVSLEEHLVLEAFRELEEEASLKPDGRSLIRAALISDQVPDGNLVSVGSVHLGIWYLRQVTQDEVGALEDGIILNGQWMTIDEIFSNLGRFEPWSQIIIQHFLDTSHASLKL